MYFCFITKRLNVHFLINIAMSVPLSQRNSVFIPFCVLIVWLSATAVHAQLRPFSTDSIKLVDDEVVFTYRFEPNLDKKELLAKTYYFLDQELDPYSGGFLINTADSIVCRITDYLDIESGMLHTFGMYMTYDLAFVFYDNACDLIVSNIKFVEKSSFERQEETTKELYLTEYSAKDIMVDEKYTQLFKRGASDKISVAAIQRLNEIVGNLRLYFME